MRAPLVWSKPAALRALRPATLVIPSLLAVCDLVVGDVQMATFAAFGGFATLVFAGFSGSRRDKLVAHLTLAVTGSVLLVIGTAVNGSTPVAAVVTLAVVFVVLFAGIAGPNAASGATAVLLAYILPAASPGTLAMIPSRLAGWWLASAAGTLAVLTLAPRPPGDRLRARAVASAKALADELDAALSGTATPEDLDALIATKHALMDAFDATPYRPTGSAASDRAVAGLVESLEWCTGLVHDAVHEGTDLQVAPPEVRSLVESSARVLRDTQRVLEGTGPDDLASDVNSLRRVPASLGPDAGGERDGAGRGIPSEGAVHQSFHAQLIAIAAGAVATDTLVATRHGLPAGDRFERLHAVAAMLRDHASVRSVWFRNSARGAVAVAAAVSIADVTNVQHGFWVVLGALSVLRTNATSTGANALRAIGGTAIGFLVGAGLLLAIGTHGAALWAVLPVAILVGAYTPGTAPFAAGQAAFTVTIGVLYNILVPVGWTVGVVRVEDVALGVAVSAVAGVLFWPRGAGAIVADDLAQSFHLGGVYLVQATSWALGVRARLPDAGAAAHVASVRLDDALRAYLTEQGAKPVPKEQLWRLVSGALRVRLAAECIAQLPRSDGQPDGSHALVEASVDVAGVIDGLAERLGRVPPTVARELAGAPSGDGHRPGSLRDGGLLIWLYLDHLRRQLELLWEPADAVRARRSQPWWR